MSDFLNNDEFKRLLVSWPSKAIHHLYTFHRDSLLKISQYRTRSNAAAEDIVQDAFADLWERHAELGQKKVLAIASYISATVRNKSVDFNKESMRRKESPLNDNLGGGHETKLDSDDIETLWKLIAALPKREQQCIVMKYFQTMTYEEIAVAIGISIKTVEANLTSARKRLRKYKSLFY